MNFILIFVFLGSLLNLCKYIFKGYKTNEVDFLVDFIFFTSSLVPLLVNLFVFIKSDCFHIKVIKANLMKVLLLDYFDVYHRNQCEKGAWYFCGNKPDTHTVLTDTDVLVITNFTPWFEYMGLEGSKLIMNEGLKKIVMKNINVKKELILGVKQSIIDEVIKLGFNLEVDKLKNLLDRKRFMKYTLHMYYGEYYLYCWENTMKFDVVDLSLMQLSFLKFDEFLKLFEEDLGPLEAVYNSLILSSTGNEIKIKHSGGVSSGCTIRNGLSKVDTCILFSLMRSGLVFVDKCATSNKGHILSLQEIMKLLSVQSSIGMVNIKKSEFWLLGDCSLEENIRKTINDCDYYLKNSEALTDRYGRNVAGFILDYTKEFFGYENNAAIKFLSTRSSCWRYRSISTNWQAKRYLCDINYILNKAGTLGLTHLDLSLKPTMRILSKTHLIPLCDKDVKRSQLEYNIVDKVEKIDEDIQAIKKSRSIGKKNKKINELLLLKEAYFHHANGNLNQIDPKVIKEFLKVNTIEKTSEKKTVESSVSTSFEYRDALLSNINKQIGVIKATLKLSDKILMEKKKSHLPILKKINENLLMAKNTKTIPVSINQGKSFMKPPKPLKLKETPANDTMISNYYGVLENYIEEVSGLVPPTVTEDEYKKVVLHNYDKKIGSGKNFRNCYRICVGESSHLSFRQNFLQSSHSFASPELIYTKMLTELEKESNKVIICKKARKAKMNTISRRQRRKIGMLNQPSLNVIVGSKRKRVPDSVFDVSVTKRIRKPKFNIKVCTIKLKRLFFKTNIFKKTRERIERENKLKEEENKIKERQMLKEKEILDEKNRKKAIENSFYRVNTIEVRLSKLMKKRIDNNNSKIDGRLYLRNISEYKDQSELDEEDNFKLVATRANRPVLPSIFQGKLYYNENKLFLLKKLSLIRNNKELLDLEDRKSVV